jgi:hypothetical protein
VPWRRPVEKHILRVEPYPSFAEKRNVSIDARKSNDISST